MLRRSHAKHFIEPVDATKMVELANLITHSVSRPITWLHMPVPIDRTDDAFYTPLKDLRLHPETELYLGLVHAQDGVEGTRRRIETAKKYAPSFGIGSECGISRGRDRNLALEFIKDVCRSRRSGGVARRYPDLNRDLNFLSTDMAMNLLERVPRRQLRLAEHPERGACRGARADAGRALTAAPNRIEEWCYCVQSSSRSPGIRPM